MPKLSFTSGQAVLSFYSRNNYPIPDFGKLSIHISSTVVDFTIVMLDNDLSDGYTLSVIPVDHILFCHSMITSLFKLSLQSPIAGFVYCQ